MNHNITDRKLARGHMRWQAPRMKPIVQKLGSRKVKKQKGNFVR